MTNAPPKDLATLQEQVKRMKEQAAVAAQRARDDVQAVEIAASSMKAKFGRRKAESYRCKNAMGAKILR